MRAQYGLRGNRWVQVTDLNVDELDNNIYASLLTKIMHDIFIDIL